MNTDFKIRVENLFRKSTKQKFWSLQGQQINKLSAKLEKREKAQITQMGMKEGISLPYLWK